MIVGGWSGKMTKMWPLPSKSSHCSWKDQTRPQVMFTTIVVDVLSDHRVIVVLVLSGKI